MSFCDVKKNKNVTAEQKMFGFVQTFAKFGNSDKNNLILNAVIIIINFHICQAKIIFSVLLGGK